MTPIFAIALAVLQTQTVAQRPGEMSEIYRLLELSPKQPILPSDLDSIEKGVRSGSTMGVRLARQLRRFAPLRVSAALEEGAQKSTDAMICFLYFRELSVEGTPEVKRTLDRNIRNSKELWRAWAAGSALLSLDPASAAAALVDRLPETVAPGSKVAEMDIARLDFMLIGSGQGKAIRALSDHMAVFSTTRKCRVISGLGHVAFEKGKATHSWSETPDEVVEFQSEVERLLALELNDVEPTQGSIFTERGEFSNLRMCDRASLALARLFPSKYWFHLYSETRNRDYMRWLNLRTWEGK